MTLKPGEGRAWGVAGVLAMPSIRSAVERAKFQGLDVRLWEGRGWIEREWEVVGPADWVRGFHGLIKRLETP